MQKLIISGMVARDAVLRRTQGGDDVLGFSIVCDNGKDKSGNRRDGTFYDCSLWGKRASAMEPHFKKGQFLSLEGRPSARAHNDKIYMQLRVNDFTFCGEKRQSSGGNSGGYDQSPDNSGYGAGSRPDTDDIPFFREWRG